MADQQPPQPDPDDLGSPVTELRELREEPSSGFMARIRGRIHRRLSVSEMVDFTFSVFFQTLFDYLDLLMSALPGSAKPTAKEKD